MGLLFHDRFDCRVRQNGHADLLHSLSSHTKSLIQNILKHNMNTQNRYLDLLFTGLRSGRSRRSKSFARILAGLVPLVNQIGWLKRQTLNRQCFIRKSR